jgi:hypothetical protein
MTNWADSGFIGKSEFLGKASSPNGGIREKDSVALSSLGERERTRQERLRAEGAIHSKADVKLTLARENLKPDRLDQIFLALPRAAKADLVTS